MDGFVTIFSNESDSDEEELVLLLEVILEPIIDNLSIHNVTITIDDFKKMIPDTYSHLRELIDMSILSKLAVSIRDEYIAVALLENAIMLAYIYPGY